MTTTEAHQVIARWQRILIPLGVRTEAMAAQRMEESLWGVAGGGILLLIIAAALGSKSNLAGAVAFLGFIQIIGSVLILRRIRESRRILSGSPITIIKS